MRERHTDVPRSVSSDRTSAEIDAHMPVGAALPNASQGQASATPARPSINPHDRRASEAARCSRPKPTQQRNPPKPARTCPSERRSKMEVRSKPPPSLRAPQQTPTPPRQQTGRCSRPRSNTEKNLPKSARTYPAGAALHNVSQSQASAQACAPLNKPHHRRASRRPAVLVKPRARQEKPKADPTRRTRSRAQPVPVPPATPRPDNPPGHRYGPGPLHTRSPR